MGKTGLFGVLILGIPACSAGPKTEPAGSSRLSVTSEAGSSDGGSAEGGCVCCSATRGPLTGAEAGDAADCNWCPATSRCVHFVGGAVGGTAPLTNPAYTCATAVENGGTGGPGIDSCTP